jgi:hypothetical protein
LKAKAILLKKLIDRGAAFVRSTGAGRESRILFGD